MEWLKNELPKLVRNNDEVKGAILSALSGVMVTREDIKDLVLLIKDRFKKVDERFEKMDQRFFSLQKQMDERFETIDNRILDNTEILKKMQVSISRIESKEGRDFEILVRDLLSETLKMEKIDPNCIENVSLSDKEGEIFYKGFTTDIDILIGNGNTYAIELKATANTQDIGHFIQVIKLYEKKQSSSP